MPAFVRASFIQEFSKVELSYKARKEFRLRNSAGETLIFISYIFCDILPAPDRTEAVS